MSAAGVAARLTAAADLLERCGWHRNAMWATWPRPHDGRAPLCAWGAIVATATDAVERDAAVRDAVERDACVALLERLLRSRGVENYWGLSLVYWNDERVESAAQVIALLREGAAAARARESSA